MSLGSGARRGIGLASGLLRRVTTGSPSLYRGALTRQALNRQITPSTIYLSVLSSNLHSQSHQSVFSETDDDLNSTSTIHELTIQPSTLGGGDDTAETASNVANSLANLPSGNLGPLATLFSSAPPVQAAQDLFIQLHDMPGMDWTKTIIAATLGIRVLVGLPLAVFQQKSMAKLENLQPQFKQLATDLSRETSIAVKIYNWNERKAKSAFKASYKRHWRNLVEEHNCHPMRALFLVWLQVPFWICFSSALRNVVYAIPEPRTSEMLLHWMQMAAENPFWIESLAAVDPFILPAIFLAANLTNIQINTMRKLTVPQTRLQKVIPWVFRVGVVGISVLAAFTPSAVTMYWATSSVCALLQNLLMKTPPVRRFFRIPPTPSNP